MGCELHRLQTNRVHCNDPVLVRPAGFGCRVGVFHLDQWLRGCVAVGQVLKDWTPEGVLLVLRNVGEELPITLDNKTGEPAFGIRIGCPGQHIADDVQVRWS